MRSGRRNQCRQKRKMIRGKNKKKNMETWRNGSKKARFSPFLSLPLSDYVKPFFCCSRLRLSFSLVRSFVSFSFVENTLHEIDFKY